MICMFGDFNEVREENDRFGTNFSKRGAELFNKFIDDAGLVEVQLGARKYIWINKAGTKMSKLDRFFVSLNLVNEFSDKAVVVLQRRWSDHNPILLHKVLDDFGPKPFRVFKSWLMVDGLNEVVTDAWIVNSIIEGGNVMVGFKINLYN